METDVTPIQNLKSSRFCRLFGLYLACADTRIIPAFGAMCHSGVGITIRHPVAMRRGLKHCITPHPAYIHTQYAPTMTINNPGYEGLV